ncbi:hypothetical protein [Sphingomonas phage Carli]|nr:hypothetical protein [Sphingomonas phage Carli]
MLIDDAANAFRKAAANDRYTKERSLVNAKGWVVKDGEGNRYTSGMGVPQSEAEELIIHLEVKDGITAAMQEMISVRVLTMALINCGAPAPSALALANKLLPAIITLAASEGNEILIEKAN